MGTSMAENTKQTQHVKLLIIGSGPAGYTAAIYAARAELERLVEAVIELVPLTRGDQFIHRRGSHRVRGPGQKTLDIRPRGLQQLPRFHRLRELIC